MSIRLRPLLRLPLAALLWLLGSAATVRAESASLTLPDLYAPPAAARFAKSTPGSEGEPGTETRAPLTLRPSMLSGARLIEMPSHDLPGQHARPKYALGFRSSAMKSFARGIGLDADTCLLPLIRARTSISQGGDVSGRVMVYARCSFH